MPRSRLSLGAMAAAVLLTACEASKSANPLSPVVAGPIPGVDITAPTPAQPGPGAQVAVDQQPVTLVINNSTTSGVRPLSYSFEMATDADFNSKVLVRDGITPGDGRTSLRLPDPLASGRTYYWRARAQDGANTGPNSATFHFAVYTPIVIQAPVLVAPINNVKTADLHPQFVFGNAPRSGPAGAVSYLMEVSTTQTFATKVAVWTTGEQPNQTALTAPQDFAYATQYFWRVRASDPTTIGPWSATQAFQTPEAPFISMPTPTPTPTPTGPVPGDGLNLGAASVYNSPSDVAAWAVTARLTRLDLTPSGVHVEFTKQDSWPDVWPPGWAGPLQYTLWIVISVNGQLYTSGCIEFWRGLYENGGPVNQYAQNWYFDPLRWGPMVGHQPAPGEQVGFFVTAGDSRNNGPVAVKERSQVVVVSFPSASGQSFRF